MFFSHYASCVGQRSPTALAIFPFRPWEQSVCTHTPEEVEHISDTKGRSANWHEILYEMFACTVSLDFRTCLESGNMVHWLDCIYYRLPIGEWTVEAYCNILHAATNKLVGAFCIKIPVLKSLYILKNVIIINRYFLMIIIYININNNKLILICSIRNIISYFKIYICFIGKFVGGLFDYLYRIY